MFGNPLLLGDDGYQISRSVRTRSSASAYFNRTPASVGNRQKFTWSGWIKRGILGTTQVLITAGTSATDRTMLLIEPGNELRFYSIAGGTGQGDIKTTAVFRDPSAWYHVVYAVDTTQATAANRLKIYVNNVLQTLTTTTAVTLNANTYINNTTAHTISRESYTGSNYFDGYHTEMRLIDGQQLDPLYFGQTDAATGVWSPKKYNGTYGTNGFYLNFSDNSGVTATTIGKDYSGNGNNWTPNNISVTAGVTYDSMLDVPTSWADGGNGRGNYPVWNPLQKGASAINTTATLSQANLLATGGAISNTWSATSTFVLPQTGKWYFECEMSPTAYGNGQFGLRSLSNSSVNCYAQLGVGAVKNNATAYSYTGYNTGSTNKIGIAYDADNNLYWQTDINGTWLNSKTPGIDTTGLVNGLTAANDYVIGWAYNSGAEANLYCYVNFGQRPFAYTPPSGFKALHTGNLPDPTIKKGNQYFDATTYTGNGGSNSVSNGNFQPDLIWAKSRNNATNHGIWDAVRGSNNLLFSNLTDAESASTNLNMLVNSTGFSINGANSAFNANSSSQVAWQWKEGATQGFDIVTFTGDGSSPKNIAHSLGVAPKMIIIKSRNNVSGWNSYHASLGNTQQINLQSTAAAVTSIDWWNNTSPTSSQFTIGANINLSGWTFIAYLFAETAGFSKFGSYTGTGNADGPFVFLGFRPRWLLIRASNGVAAWMIFDTARDTYNQHGVFLQTQSSAAEGSTGATDPIDTLSNGFKVRANGSGSVNASGGNYIYAAFAENPFKYSLAR